MIEEKVKGGTYQAEICASEKNLSIIDLQSVTASNVKLTEAGYGDEKTDNKSAANLLDEVYDPFSNRQITHPTSDFGALVHLFKGSFGSGILAVPVAFKNAGLVAGLLGTILVGMLCAHCVTILVKCAHVLSVRDKKPSLTFGETAETAFKTGPKAIRKYSSIARRFVSSALFSTYYLGNTVYIILVSQAFQEIINNRFETSYGIRWYTLLVTVLVVPLGIGRTLKFLVPVSAFGIVFIVFGLMTTGYYAIQDLPPISERDFVARIDQMPLFFSTIVFAMEGIGTVLPIENSMKNPDHFRGVCGVVSISMTMIVTLYSVVGFIGYLRFGELTNPNITLNLPHNLLSEVVKFLVAMSILFTYGLQFCVPSEIVWNEIKHKVSSKYENLAYYTMRGSLILGTVILAIIVPNLGPFIGLVGALCLASLGLFTPAMIEMVTYWEDERNSYRILKNGLIMIFSLLVTATGTYVSVEEIVREYLK